MNIRRTPDSRLQTNITIIEAKTSALTELEKWTNFEQIGKKLQY